MNKVAIPLEAGKVSTLCPINCIFHYMVAIPLEAGKVSTCETSGEVIK